jgi:hypothetical protein
MSRPSYKKYIDAHCKSCIYDDLVEGTWRMQVALCPCTSCELYEVRPLPKKWPLRGQKDSDDLLQDDCIADPNIFLESAVKALKSGQVSDVL